MRRRLIMIESPYPYWWKGGRLEKHPATPFSSHKVFRTSRKAYSAIEGIFRTVLDVDEVILLETVTRKGRRQFLETRCVRRRK